MVQKHTIGQGEMGTGSDLTMYEICLLHSRADRALRTIIAEHLEQASITMMEWLLLGTVKNAPKDGLTMSAVASTLDVTLPQVTALSASLTRAKLLKQKVSSQDRRSRRLAVTPAGKSLLADVEADLAKALQQWTGDIPNEQLESYLETIKVLAERQHGR